MTGQLTGTVALITGASSGIGEATALALAAEGAAIAVAARRKDRLDALAGKITADGGRVAVLEADITDRSQAEGVVAETVQTFGRLDTLVNNAGRMLLGPTPDITVEEWVDMVQLNLLALMWTTKAALPHLLTAAEEQPRRVADLVNISSVAGRFPRPGSAGYNATKFGVNGFSEALRQEYTQRFVRVSVIEPGATDTELMSHNRDEVQELQRQRFGDMDRIGAEDIADAIRYVVTRPRHVAFNELLIRPTQQV